MSDAVCVYGLWHLGCVIAASLAEAGFTAVGLDPDKERIAALREARPPIAEPGLADLVRQGLDAGRLSFTSDAKAALASAGTLVVAFDTPVDARDNADSAWVRARLEDLRPFVQPSTLVVVSSQVPVGFTRALEQDWRKRDASLRFAYSPENLRLGRALETFRRAERAIVGLGADTERGTVARLYQPFTPRIDWMSLESAEMTKHAINAFLALSVTYANELARISERVGADASEVERGLRSDARVGAAPYLSPGGPIAGGTLLRDVAFLNDVAAERGVAAPVLGAIGPSNAAHGAWARDRVAELTAGVASPRVALLGLTYKPGTDTLRGSSALELGRWLAGRGAEVIAFDPAVRDLPADANAISLAATLDAALASADVAVLATPWPEFRTLGADDLVRGMRRPVLVDQAGFLAHLADDPRVTYVRVGRPRT